MRTTYTPRQAAKVKRRIAFDVAQAELVLRRLATRVDLMPEDTDVEYQLEQGLDGIRQIADFMGEVVDEQTRKLQPKRPKTKAKQRAKRS